MAQSPLSALTLQTHGSKYSAGATGSLFVGANPSGVTTSAGLATTYVGLVLSNPAGCAKKLSIRRVAAAFIVAPSIVTGFNLITGFAAGGITAHTTPITPRTSLLGGSAVSLGKLDSAATLVGTPLYTMVLGQTQTAVTLASFSIDLEGGIILIPGAYAAIGTTIAGPASGFMGSFEWEEILN